MIGQVCRLLPESDDEWAVDGEILDLEARMCDIGFNDKVCRVHCNVWGTENKRSGKSAMQLAQ